MADGGRNRLQRWPAIGLLIVTVVSALAVLVLPLFDVDPPDEFVGAAVLGAVFSIALDRRSRRQ